MTETSIKDAIPEVDRVIVRFAGDSGDGMQLTGDRFTTASALFGNDLSTLPEFPAEIRAPAGTLAGVSAFQVHISNHDILTPGDAPHVLVAMNPAALKAELSTLVDGGTIIVNSDSFEERNLAKAGYETSPLADDSLAAYRVLQVPMTSLTKEACKDLGVKPRDAERSKNFFALGLLSWMYSRPVKPTIDWIEAKFAGRDQVIAANKAAFSVGHAYGETAELTDYRVVVQPAQLPSGTYTNISGNTALAWGLVAAGHLSGLRVFLGSYPITPASDILHELSKHKSHGVATFQAEDEIAAVGSALGAAYGGQLGVTTTSGPGIALKGETIGLAVSLELPLVIVNIQRGGPSTGLPTKTEAADLLMAMYGRHGESPIPVIAARTPADCFDKAIEAARIAIEYRTPVMLLSDGYLANSSEPWLLPEVDTLEPISVDFADTFNQVDDEGGPVFWPYLRDEKLVRPWAIPGTPDLMHRIGGLEKQDGTGNVSYDPSNHAQMTAVRAERIAGIEVPNVELSGDENADLLIVGWGSTWGAIAGAVRRVRNAGGKVAHAHLTYLNPFPANLGDIVKSFDRILVPEMNLGQLVRMLRAEYLVDARPVSKVSGQPFTAGELQQVILSELGD